MIRVWYLFSYVAFVCFRLLCGCLFVYVGLLELLFCCYGLTVEFAFAFGIYLIVFDAGGCEFDCLFVIVLIASILILLLFYLIACLLLFDLIWFFVWIAIVFSVLCLMFICCPVVCDLVNNVVYMSILICSNYFFYFMIKCLIIFRWVVLLLIVIVFVFLCLCLVCLVWFDVFATYCLGCMIVVVLFDWRCILRLDVGCYCYVFCLFWLVAGFSLRIYDSGLLRLLLVFEYLVLAWFGICFWIVFCLGLIVGKGFWVSKVGLYVFSCLSLLGCFWIWIWFC